MTPIEAMLAAYDRRVSAGATRARKAGGKAATFQGIDLKLDRPKGFVQEGTDENGKAWRRVYRFDYGFIPKTDGGDGEELDVFLGPSAAAPTSWWAVQVKADGTFDEFKVCLGFSSGELAKACYRMHIPARFCAGWFEVPVTMIKSLLGLEPRAVIKALRKAETMKTISRLQKIAGVSFEQVTRALEAALRDAYPTQDDGCSPTSPWPREVYDDRVIYSLDGKVYQDAYTFANGVATLAGAPIPVVATYVPASQQQQPQAPVTAADGSQKSESTMKIAKGGGGDIVQLAAERLGLIAKTLGKGDGMITAEVKAEIDAVVALLETASELYTGGGGAVDEGAGADDDDGEATELDMADLVGEEKAAGTIVKMSGPAFLAYSAAQISKARTETDPVRKAILVTSTALSLAYARQTAKSAQFSGATPPAFPVMIVGEPKPTEQTISPDAAPPAGLGPAASGGATSVGGATAPTSEAAGSPAFVQKMADVQKAIEALRAPAGGGAPAAPAPVVPVAKSTPTGTEPGLWPASYVDTLPDSSFLYVEAQAQKSAAGLTLPAFRHFPVRDVDGKLSKAQLAQAIKMIPLFGATPEFKADLLKKAHDLFGLEQSIEKSALDAAGRGDEGWPDDMADPDFLAGRQPHKATKVFGFDRIPEKVEAIVGGRKG